ncbi:type IV pilus modification protein PilV [Methylomonas sp. AM2-LC]|uniref:type IV pilus modification protein PilV n=1 Tax=Methylomonas sp. AM2-LC TaxID=3153301 RepID=UPI0032665001
MKRKQSAFTLLEVLVTMVVVGLGLLGQAALMAQSSKSNNSAYYHTQASLLASDYLERMRMNQTSAMAGGYDITITTTVPTSTTTLQDFEKHDWLTNVDSMLPGWQATVKTTTNNVVITLTWTELSKGANSSGGASTTTFITNSTL